MLYLIKRSDGGVSVVNHIEDSKKTIEEVINDWQETYEPQSYLSHREIQEQDIPTSREFRGAWVDVTQDSRIDIDCEKARDLKLAEFRVLRNTKLNETDKEILRAIETGDIEIEQSLKVQRQALRDATEPLKQLDVAGKYNDEEMLNQIKTLGTFSS